MYAILYVFADFWIELLLGSKYLDSVVIFKILIADIPLIAVGTILGIFELLPRKLDFYFTISVVVAGIWSIFSIYVLVPRYGLNWMAYTVLIAECLVIFVCAVSLAFNKGRNV
jgi:O-antigen/teichoic acid export membrane protein